MPKAKNTYNLQMLRLEIFPDLMRLNWVGVIPKYESDFVLF